MNQIYFQQPQIYLDSFQYSSEQPTFYTEALSHWVLSTIRDLCNVSACVYVEDKTPDLQQSLVSDYVSQFSAWLKTCEEAVTSYLIEDSSSLSLPVLPVPPQISIALAGSVLLYKPAIVALAVDSVAAVVRIIQTAIANRRQSQVVRLLDKAFFTSSYFGLWKESIFQKIVDTLTSINWDLHGDNVKGETKGVGSLIYDALTTFVNIPDTEDFEALNLPEVLLKLSKNRDLMKLIAHIVVSGNGHIDSTDFTLAGTDE